jgi:hypothetical protein
VAFKCMSVNKPAKDSVVILYYWIKMRARAVYRSVSINMDCYINRKRYSSINEEVKRLFVRDNVSDEGQVRPTEATWY